MSNAPATKQTASDKAGTAPTTPEVDIDAMPSIRVNSMTFVTKALPVSGVNSVHDHITARANPNANGVDVWYIPELQHFKVIRNNREVTSGKPLMFHVSRVEFWEPL